MYRCSICQTVSKPNQPLLRHVIERPVLGKAKLVDGVMKQEPRTEIECEIPICSTCHADLATFTLAEVMHHRGQPRPEKVCKAPPPPQARPVPPKPPRLPVPVVTHQPLFIGKKITNKGVNDAKAS